MTPIPDYDDIIGRVERAGAAVVWEAADAARSAARAAAAVSNDQSAMCRYIEYGVELLEGK